MNRKQWERVYRKLYRKTEKALAGGLQYGVDWSTLRIVWPDMYTALQFTLSKIRSADDCQEM